MPFRALLILCGLLLFWLYSLQAGLKRPQKLLLICVATISVINFSFFKGEVLERIAIPDILFLTLALVCFLREIILRKPVWSFSRTPAVVFLLLVAGILASLSAPPWDRTMLFGQGHPATLYFSMMMFFLVTQLIVSESDLMRYLKAWVVAVGIAVVVSCIDMGDLFSTFQGRQYDDSGFFGIHDLFTETLFPHAFLSAYSFRIIGSFRNPGQLADFCLTSFFVLLAFSFVPKQHRILKVLLWILAPTLVFCALLTGRFSVFPSFAIGFLLISFYFMAQSKKLILIWVTALILVLAGFGVSASFNPKIYELVITRNLDSASNLLAHSGFLSEQLRVGGKIFQENSLFGIGLGRFIQSEYHEFIRGHSFHSTYIQFLAETGIFGMFTYLIFMGYFLMLAYKNLRASWQTSWRDFHAILLFGFVSMLLSYSFNRHMKEHTFWLFIALIYIGWRLLKNKAREIPVSKEAKV